MKHDIDDIHRLIHAANNLAKRFQEKNREADAKRATVLAGVLNALKDEIPRWREKSKYST